MTLKTALNAARNPDGGWPYYVGKTSRLEPTVWALLALTADGATPGLGPLAEWPRRGGSYVDRSGHGAVSMAFNGLAGVALSALGAPGDLSASLLEWLLSVRGESLPTGPSDRQNNSLQGWAWLSGTFSWVEPTAWALLGVKRLSGARRSPAAASRIDEGERLLFDRACVGGGWNYGNSSAFGADLRAHVPTSALSLLALADRAREPAVVKGLRFLELNGTREASPMALGLTRIALGRYGVGAADMTAALEQAWKRTAHVGNIHTQALALYALAGDPFDAFRL